ncbi:hypothetical protein RF11_10870 [Thelohanellus kitauei]|uniref:Uncharacterized protein n=1 Tax=Thelohanellus kitauei TaxID=669202 RepID=A0A0C2JYF9_THEKT|nr:hypothetical protein RF11_10870 [Thelohanellus kitauei]
MCTFVKVEQLNSTKLLLRAKKSSNMTRLRNRMTRATGDWRTLENCNVYAPNHAKLRCRKEYQDFLGISIPEIGPTQDIHSKIVVQIDEWLLRGKRMHDLGRVLLGNQPLPLEDRLEIEILEEEPIDPYRNYGRRISLPWIFGLLECIMAENGSFVSGEVRLFVFERWNAETLHPIIQ